MSSHTILGRPVPSLIVYPRLGPTDHRPIEDRVLTYTSDALDADLAIAGPVTAVLYAKLVCAGYGLGGATL